MFCPNCGKDITDNAQICPYCGYSSQTATPTSAYTSAPAIPKQSLFKNKIFLIASAAVLTLIIIITSVLLITGGKGAKTPEQLAEKYITASASQDIKKALPLLSQYAKNEIMDFDDGIQQATDEMIIAKYKLSQSQNGIENAITIISVNVYNVKAYDIEEKTDFLEDYYEDYGKGSNEQITEVADVDMQFVYSQNGKTDSASETFTCIRVKNKWYIVSM